MASQWDTWLRALKKAVKGGIVFDTLQIDRGRPYSKTLTFDEDYSGNTFEASLKSSPDASTTLVNFTVTVSGFIDGVTVVELELTDSQTLSLPSDADLDGVEELVFDLLMDGERILAGVIEITGRVTD